MASLIRHGLLKEGLAVDIAASGEDSLWMVGAVDYDAIVLDVMLPGIDGFETCRQIRAQGRRAPVLMLTARDSVEDRVAGLDSGADDYLVKPFAFAELLARLRALARRGDARAAERARGGRSAARPGDAPRLAGLRADPALGQGVRAARDVHAAARRGALAPAPARARVGLRLREPLERRRRLHRPPAQQDRRAVRPALAGDGAGSRLPAARGRRRLDATADPPARLGRVRGRDGRRARRSRGRSSTCASDRTSRRRSTGSCGCARTTSPCSSASRARRSRPSIAAASSRRARPTRRCSTGAAAWWTRRRRSAARRCSAPPSCGGPGGRDLHEPRIGAGPRRAVAHLRHARDATRAPGSCSWSESRARTAPRRCAACATSC